MTYSLLWTGVVALAAAVLLTPALAAVMTRLGVTDRPDGRRKLHGREVPLAGGLAVCAAAAVAVFAATFAGQATPQDGESSFWRWFALSTGLLCAVGVADDAVGLRGRHKLLGQILAVSLLIGSGLVIERVSLFGWNLELGVTAIPFTMFWLLGAVNAMNLIDGMDGLAGTVGAMIGLALCVLSGVNGHYAEAAVAAAFVGGLVGFLVFNFPPAKVFLGDTGSMATGLVLGVVAIRSSLKETATFAAAAPLAIWTLPVLDVCMAILRRKLTGRSLYATDRGHLHHRLRDRGLGARASLVFVASLCAVTTAGALASVVLDAEWLAPASAAAVVSLLVLSRSFGHSECALLARRVRSFASSLVPVRSGPAEPVREHRSRLQGTREWDSLWESLIGFAERLGLSSLQLDVSFPSAHEQFFASWKRPAKGGSEGLAYHAELPLSSPSGAIGMLRIGGHAPAEDAVGWVGDVIGGLRPFEAQIADLLHSASDDDPGLDRASVRPARVDAARESKTDWDETGDSAQRPRFEDEEGRAHVPDPAVA